MIEQGLALLLTAATSLPVFAIELPKDFVSASNPTAICYHSILSKPLYELDGQNALTWLEIQVDCHGFTAAQAYTLAKTIKDYLSGGYHGTLSDADSTKVQGMFKLPGQVDGYSDTNRTYVRSLEYNIAYIEN